ncbi:hypothetical protein AG1IA_00495 [Rhizoctonia solani AG-1 IA]|uniref:Uncharacterized protein n=1 Tax=Thanatephorus cucumeris (strain AG1-IA) TaxID=983506 RepID=L8X9W9_THACA|nr:hypothetical protein AG1IA_00495 [Rhizoctonia solani AG-1 IA]
MNDVRYNLRMWRLEKHIIGIDSRQSRQLKLRVRPCQTCKKEQSPASPRANKMQVPAVKSEVDAVLWPAPTPHAHKYMKADMPSSGFGAVISVVHNALWTPWMVGAMLFGQIHKSVCRYY